MKKNIRLIALDLDGTLLQNHGTVSEEGIRVLKELRNRGIRIVIASGRPYYSIRRIFSEPLYDFAACSNGQVICDRDGNVLFREPDLNHEDIRFLMSSLRHFPMIMSFSENGIFHHTCAFRFRPFARLYHAVQDLWHRIRRIPVFPRPLTPLSQVCLAETGKLCFSSHPAVLQKFAAGIPASRYAVYFVSPHWLEIQRSGVSKGAALLKIAGLCGIPQAETAALGDGENDIPMLQAAGIGVAMGNAMPSVRKAADETAPPVRQDGAVQWMRDNLL